MRKIIQLILPIFSLCLISLNTNAMSDAAKLCYEFNVEGLNMDEETSRTDGWRKTYGRDISTKTFDQIRNLPTEVKQKIIIVAKNAILEGYDSETYKKPSDIHNTVQAVQFIREINEFEEEEHYYAYYENNRGQRVNMITFYPGAQVGAIFSDDSLTTLATISDGWISCVD